MQTQAGPCKSCHRQQICAGYVLAVAAALQRQTCQSGVVIEAGPCRAAMLTGHAP
jgi:hypothetical protein